MSRTFLSRLFFARRALLPVLLPALAMLLLTACASSSAVRAPTPTPTATPPSCTITTPADPAAVLSNAVCRATPIDALSAQTTYDAHAGSVIVHITIRGTVPVTDDEIAGAQERAKVVTFEAQQAIWTSGVALKMATVAVLGPVQDEYDNYVNDVYSASYLGGATAAKIEWSTADADATWDRYDGVFLRPSFQLVDSVPGAP
jgi:hypothetical protein